MYAALLNFNLLLGGMQWRLCDLCIHVQKHMYPVVDIGQRVFDPGTPKHESIYKIQNIKYPPLTTPQFFSYYELFQSKIKYPPSTQTTKKKEWLEYNNNLLSEVYAYRLN
jgi:hypothetical protein